jgi:hypothetical protein
MMAIFAPAQCLDRAAAMMHVMTRMLLPLRITQIFAAAAAILLASAPAAAELRDFCPDRPGLGTPACTMDPGHFDVELGLADWTLTRDSGTRTDDMAYGDILVRYGLGYSLEAQVHWTAVGTERFRDASGIRRQTGTGDVSFALRRNLVHPDGSGLSAALMPVVTLPTGSDPLGAGTWGASLVVPMSQQLPHGLQLDFTGEIDAAPDSDGRGRHLGFGAVAGLDVDVSDTVGATFELAASRDEDPSATSDQLVGGLSLAWMAKPALQIDLGANLGLAGAAPDMELYFGISRRF